MKSFTKLLVAGGGIITFVSVVTGPLSEWNARREGALYLKNLEEKAYQKAA
ncbi:hypothetical protein H310_04148 [Aphanomyces invadans]|uniref:Uncharacterized protein n=1 Tax=Aphanomyces invadans TaxID=157072 RepID=A0A024UFE5_9STRA|nr:hypothetical protein H310_04148 [Aphanomyces invadans]ETW05136.1 hypothetical protein H310_04148 [Aphanomyces invadans]|eukprot:XP_008866574.1 hypothetical protein H310_04148 [Aphanomyces invadans]